LPPASTTAAPTPPTTHHTRTHPRDPHVPVPCLCQAAQQLVQQHHLAAGQHQALRHVLVGGTRPASVVLLPGRGRARGGRVHQGAVRIRRGRRALWELLCSLEKACVLSGSWGQRGLTSALSNRKGWLQHFLRSIMMLSSVTWPLPCLGHMVGGGGGGGA
jgi:hypothetical protein